MPQTDELIAMRRLGVNAMLIAEMLLNSTGADIAGHFTCDEAETVAEFLRSATRNDRDGDLFLYWHGVGDDDENHLHVNYPKPE